MPLFTVKTSRKVETSMKLEESTAKMLDRYAHFHKGSADDVVNEALEYIFGHDKDFQQHLKLHPDEQVASSVRIKKVSGSAKAAKSGRKWQQQWQRHSSASCIIGHHEQCAVSENPKNALCA